MSGSGTSQIPDELWKQIKPLLPPEPGGAERTAPYIDDRKAMEAVFYMLSTGRKWEELPKEPGTGSAMLRRFQEWRRTGVFDRMWQIGILTYDELRTLIRRSR